MQSPGFKPGFFHKYVPFLFGCSAAFSLCAACERTRHFEDSRFGKNFEKRIDFPGFGGYDKGVG